jgi:hypothetical protein
MPVIEYKLVKTANGNEKPGFVKKGGNWRDPTNFSMVGWLEPKPRKYYVPDTIVELDLDAFIERMLKIHEVRPFVWNHPDDPDLYDGTGEPGPNMTEEQVRDMAETWYENFVAENS